MLRVLMPSLWILHGELNERVGRNMFLCKTELIYVVFSSGEEWTTVPQARMDTILHGT
jgi:hypothetical protein